jgi:hypothetical protein
MGYDHCVGDPPLFAEFEAPAALAKTRTFTAFSLMVFAEDGHW